MSEIRKFGFQTVTKSEHKPVRISAQWDFRQSGFLGHTRNVQISACLDFRVSEIGTFEHVPLALASKWLEKVFFCF